MDKELMKKTEDLLKMYHALARGNGSGVSRVVVRKLDRALSEMRSDNWYDIIVGFYFEGLSRESLADMLGVSDRTVTRHKNRLIRELTWYMFPDESVECVLNAS